MLFGCLQNVFFWVAELGFSIWVGQIVWSLYVQFIYSLYQQIQLAKLLQICITELLNNKTLCKIIYLKLSFNILNLHVLGHMFLCFLMKSIESHKRIRLEWFFSNCNILIAFIGENTIPKLKTELYVTLSNG